MKNIWKFLALLIVLVATARAVDDGDYEDGSDSGSNLDGVVLCPAGEEVVQNACQPCGTGRFKNLEAGVVDGNACTECTYRSCDPVTGKAVCPKGTQQNSIGDDCDTCDSTMYKDTDDTVGNYGTCVECECITDKLCEYCDPDSGENNGILCPAGSQRDTTDPSRCVECNTGTYKNLAAGEIDNKVCDQCECFKQATCSQCDPIDGTPLCPAGQEVIGDKCSLCADGFYKPDPQNDDTDSEGSDPYNANMCKECSCYTDKTCVNCDKATGKLTEALCNPGEQRIAALLDRCEACSHGKYSAGGTGVCTDRCPAFSGNEAVCEAAGFCRWDSKYAVCFRPQLYADVLVVKADGNLNVESIATMIKDEFNITVSVVRVEGEDGKTAFVIVFQTSADAERGKVEIAKCAEGEGVCRGIYVVDEPFGQDLFGDDEDSGYSVGGLVFNGVCIVVLLIAGFLVTKFAHPTPV